MCTGPHAAGTAAHTYSLVSYATIEYVCAAVPAVCGPSLYQ